MTPLPSKTPEKALGEAAGAHGDDICGYGGCGLSEGQCPACLGAV